MNENQTFKAFTDERGLLFDDSNHPNFPLKYHALDFGQYTFANPVFGYVVTGAISLFQDQYFQLEKGYYFSEPNPCKIDVSKGGLIIVIETMIPDYKPMFHVGGPLENEGRLKYIDGCTDSLLISPVRKGDPCLNFLHFPPNINQTQHTHPSHRIGVVTKGRGECLTPFGNLPLEEGMIFIIKEWNGHSMSVGLDGAQYPFGQHSFRTFGGVMDVLAFHPDSDFGPEDEFHPMINRTIVEGVPAAQHKKFDKFKTE